ncbi:odorant receptor 10-like isoform X3 [Megalopta genalis]|uniref:odorant receptor 10-like isoform X3 n=1 Tax=Megalopta genalis TaxID=115081 RepID=UPI003FD3BF55
MASPSAINKTMKFCLHFVGIWPGTPFPDVHKFFWIVTMILLQTYQYDYIISHYKTERLAIVIDSLTIAIPFSLVCFKLIAIWTNQRMDLPFDTNVSPAYELVVTEQILHLLSSSLTFSTFGSLLLTMTLHVGCLVDILCNRLLESSLIDKEQIRFLIIRQQEITMFVKKLEQLFTYIALVQLLANTIVTCCTGYLIVSSVGLENVVPVFLKCIMFYNVMCLDAFTYCFVGEFLEIKSNMIAETAYGIPWYDLDPNVSRQVVLLILRAHNGLPLTFGKFSKLSLESFTAMMKASASYMSVLLAMS